MASPEIAIVGGGIVGSSIAYHLSKRTTDPIVVYERDELASATTFRSTAMIGVSGPAPYHRMKEYGLRLYNEFFTAPAANPRYRQSGRLRVATTSAGARELEQAATTRGNPSTDDGDENGGGEGNCNEAVANRYANSLREYVPGGKLRDRFLVPPLGTDRIEGALYRPRYGHIMDDSRTLGPRELAMEFVERARNNGVRFETGTDVTAIRTDGDGVTGLERDDATVTDVETVVCAAGPWTDTLVASVGIDLPIERVLSPVFALELPDSLSYSLPMIKSHERSVGLHPKRDDTVLVTYTPAEAVGHPDADPTTNDDTAPDAFRERALAVAERLMPSLAESELADEWVGIGTQTPDGNPIVDTTALDGLVVAATTSGIQYAPAIGSIVARRLVDNESTPYDDAVSLSRFDGF